MIFVDIVMNQIIFNYFQILKFSYGKFSFSLTFLPWEQKVQGYDKGISSDIMKIDENDVS